MKNTEMEKKKLVPDENLKDVTGGVTLQNQDTTDIPNADPEQFPNDDARYRF